MRILNLEILSAFMMLGYDAEIEVELESLNGLVVWKLKDLIPTDLDDREKVILKAIRDGHYKVRIYLVLLKFLCQQYLRR